MKKAQAIGVLGVLSLAGTSVGLIYSGAIIDVSADTPHSSAVYRLIEWVRESTIAHQSADIQPPADWLDVKRIRRGAGNYDAMCANCHLSPGLENTELRQGLYPQPPNLSRPAVSRVDEVRTAARRFWVIKHGIKASGMPSWAKSGMTDGAIWDLTAFIHILPTLSPDQYQQQVASSDGHSHDGADHHH